MFRRFSALSLVVLFALAFAPAYAQQATPAASTATIVVTNLSSKGAGSLFQAVLDAQAGAADTITFAPGLTGTITPQSPGLIDLAHDLTIIGPGAKQLELDTAFATIKSAHLSVSNVTFAHAFSPVRNIDGTSTVTNVVFHDTYGGAAVRNDKGTVIIVNCTFLPNADSVVFNVGTATILNSTFQGNRQAVYNLGILTLANSSFQNNASAILNIQGGTMNIINTTFKDNNDAAFGPTIVNDHASLKMTNSIVMSSDAKLTTNCQGVITDGGHNLQFPGTSCGLTIASVDPQLGTLSDNGGLTQTIPLLNGSPAIGKGDPAVCASTLKNVDQRGFARAANGICDIGAFEYYAQAPIPTSTSTASASATPVVSQ